MSKEKYCHLCDFDIECLHENASHLIQQYAETHKYQQCHQKFYYSSSDFWNHLRRFHGEDRSAYFRSEQIVSSWMRVMAAVFEPADQAAGALALPEKYPTSGGYSKSLPFPRLGLPGKEVPPP